MGRPLKFHAYCAFDIRRIDTPKDGAERSAAACVKVAKNKAAPQFKPAEFDIV